MERRQLTMTPNDFIRRYNVAPVIAHFIQTVPYEVRERKGDYRLAASTIKLNNKYMEVSLWTEQLSQVEGYRGLPNVVSCWAYDVWHVEGKTYPQWLNRFKLKKCKANFGIYQSMLRQAKNARTLIGDTGVKDLISVANYVNEKKMYA
jgi:hypothetical protein